MTTIHQANRRSIRLAEYDYSQAGMYFVTLCTQKRNCLFGAVNDGIMVLNDAGQMIEEWYIEIENKFSDIRCLEMITMPNHIHFIVQNVGANVGADLCVCPPDANNIGQNVGADLRVCPPDTNEHTGSGISGEHIGSPLHRVVQWFKTMTTNHYIRGVKNDNWLPFDGKLWQRNYYEHIIRNPEAYIRIADYIINNPNNWNTDENNVNVQP